MDLWGGAGKREYPAVVFLTSWATDPVIWPYFDGWATAQGVDHYALPFDRWLNFVYYFAVRNASAEDKQKFDAAITDQVSAWHFKKAAPVIAEAKAAPKVTPKPGQERVRRMPPKPAHWGTDATNTFNSKAAITTLTAPGVSGKGRRR